MNIKYVFTIRTYPKGILQFEMKEPTVYYYDLLLFKMLILAVDVSKNENDIHIFGESRWIRVNTLGKCGGWSTEFELILECSVLILFLIYGLLEFEF